VRRLSLRTRLVLCLLVLAAVGLVAADIATYKSQESFLFQQTDNTLQANHPLADQAVNQGDGQPGGGPPGFLPGYVVEIRSPTTGRLLREPIVGRVPGTQTPPLPKLPATISLNAPTAGEPDAVTYLTAPAVSGGGRYRVRASIAETRTSC